MTLLFADGMEDNHMTWAMAGSMGVGPSRFGAGQSLSSTSASDYAETGFPATAGPIIAGFAIKPQGAGAGTIMGFQTGNVFHVAISRGASGEVIANGGNFGSLVLLGTSATGVLPAAAWSYVEVKATISATVGIVVVRVNGVEVLNLTGKDTYDNGAVSVSLLRLGAVASAGLTAGALYDDVYICDANGTVNNDFLGEITVEHLRPAADDTVTWLGSDGNSVNNYDMVDEGGAYIAGDYVGSSTVGQRDLYTTTASARPGTSPVRGVVVVAVAQKTDAGTRTMQIDIKEGAAGPLRQSAALGLPTSFGELFAVFERKNDGTTWTVADVNALRVGMEVTS